VKKRRGSETGCGVFDGLPERWAEWGGLYALAGKAEIE